MTDSKKRILSYFCMLFLPILGLILVNGWLMGAAQRSERVARIAADQTLHVNLALSALEEQLATPVSHVYSLGRNEAGVLDFIGGKSGRSAAVVEESFVSLLSRNPDYAQVSWVDERGIERFKVERSPDGKLGIASPDELQNLSERYFVRAGLKLAPAEIYVSPLDLNAADGEIERASRPLIRYVIRVLGENGKSNGIVVLALSAEKMLQHLTKYSGAGNIVLLDAEGYWLRAAKPEDERVFRLGRQERFASRHPVVWERIDSLGSGQEESATGLWTWATVRVKPRDERKVNAETWRIVAHVSGEQLSVVRSAVWLPILGQAGVVLCLFGYGIWRLGSSTEQRRRVIAELSATQAELQGHKAQLEIVVKERTQQLVDANRALQESNAVLDRKVAERTAELQHHRDHLEETVIVRTRDLAAARDAAESASRAKSELLANMSHELRTPLNHIMGFNALLAREVTSENGKKRLAKSTQATERLLRLINNLLDAARLESNALEISTVDFNLTRMLDRLAGQARPLLQEKRLDFVCEVAAGIPQCLRGDERHLAQVLGELIDNALKFSERGTIALRVRESALTPGFCVLRFDVEDQGIGIAPEACAGIFELFAQGDGSAKRRHGGTGLGLAFCRRLVKLMGGEIGVDSEVGRGSRFRLEIPLALGAAGAPRSGEFDPALVHGDMLELAQLLAEDRFDAQSKWAACCAHVGPRLADRREAFELALGNFEFEEAREILAWAAKKVADLEGVAC